MKFKQAYLCDSQTCHQVIGIDLPGDGCGDRRVTTLPRGRNLDHISPQPSALSLCPCLLP
ncbi:hypothetical protein K9N68_04615 [Kovacikia minuta CCNUW1]|uniref:hypothetical protein n=1 Tax=Kovacikia minuta TaxID=2931930 RepID=UPI001CCEEAA9|nr:hypothetical protein [Kovacikia minuta]UBF27253.1 hypothetical protein K9N68_04615 [Kovacikia minuta CCNUW1]